MAYFAQLNSENTVTQVISISNEIVPDPSPDNEQLGIDYIVNTLKLDGVWKQTSFNATFRSLFAGVGFTYDEDTDTFVAPSSPEPSPEPPPPPAE
jgi:hypothetical protein